MAILPPLAASLLLLSGQALAKPGRPTQFSLSCCSFNLGYNPHAVAFQAKRLANHSWEYGTTAEALYELYNPELTVFGNLAFPFGSLPVLDVDKPDFPALAYSRQHIRLQNNTLANGTGSAGNPASLGQSAILLGQNSPPYLKAATKEYEHLNMSVPRWSNGAMSHREGYAELWSDFVYMVPPFIAYYGAALNDTETVKHGIFQQAVDQCRLYRQVLQPSTGGGLWQHISGPKNLDTGFWSTGNAWAAMGMARVLATLMHWPSTAGDDSARLWQADLFLWIGEIVNGAMAVGKDASGLLRNYLDDSTSFGETSGTALLTAAVYRLAVLQFEAKDLFERGAKGSTGEVVAPPVTEQMLYWADENLAAVATHVNETGIASPAVNPLDSKNRTPYTSGSAEGEGFLLMLYAAYRDCVKVGVCRQREAGEYWGYQMNRVMWYQG